MHRIWVAVLGWAITAFGVLASLDGDRKHANAGALLACGLVLVIARAIAVRFDRIYPPK